MQKILIHAIRAYQLVLSPLFPPACRFFPSCSSYAIEAITRYGALRGGIMAVRRILRCHPFCSGGYDPVVEPPAAAQGPHDGRHISIR